MDIDDEDDFNWRTANGRHKRGKKPKGFGWLFLSRPSATTLEVWHRVDRYLKHRYPVRWFITQTFPAWVRRAYQRYVIASIWFVQVRTTHRFHVVTPSTLKPGFHSTEELMLHSMFHLMMEEISGYRGWERLIAHQDELKAIVAKEPCEVYEDIIRNYDELLALKTWWTETRPNRVDPWDFEDTTKSREFLDISKEAREQYVNAQKVQDAYDDEDQAMFERLSKIRRNLNG